MKQTLQFTPIDLKNEPRAEMFYYFSAVAPTGYSLTTEIDITNMRSVLKVANRKFFPAYLWLVTKTLNEQREFKMAKVDDKIGYYNTLTPLYATFHEDDKTFSLLWTEFDDDFSEFYNAYIANQKKYGSFHGALANKNQLPPPNAYTVSCVPWISFKHFSVHSYDNKPYFFPSIESGKFYEKEGRIFLPLSITCHHATTDGYHVNLFLEKLQNRVNKFEKYL